MNLGEFLTADEQAKVEEVRAWLDEAHDSQGLRHDQSCPVRHQVGTICDCWVSSVEGLLDLLRIERETCDHVHVEGTRSWRCKMPKGHEFHRSPSGHRRWVG